MKYLLLFILVTPLAWGEPLSQEISNYEIESLASRNAKFFEIGFGYKSLFEKTVDGNSYEADGMPYFQIGLNVRSFNFSGEISQQKYNSESGNLSIGSTRSSVEMWLSYLSNSEGRWSPKLGLGAGGYQDKVSTSFGDQSKSEKSQVLGLYGALAGLKWSARHFYAGLDFKLLKKQTSQNMDWSAQFGVGFRPF